MNNNVGTCRAMDDGIFSNLLPLMDETQFYWPTIDNLNHHSSSSDAVPSGPDATQKISAVVFDDGDLFDYGEWLEEVIRSEECNEEDATSCMTTSSMNDHDAAIYNGHEANNETKEEAMHGGKSPAKGSRGRKKGKGSADKSYIYAKNKMKPIVTREEYIAMVENGNPDALQHHNDYYATQRLHRLRSRLRKKLEKNPTDEDVLHQVEEHGLDKDELLQKKKAREYGKPMDGKRRDTIRDLLNQFKKDIHQFNRDGKTKRYYNIESRVEAMDERQEIVTADDPLSEGNAEADRIIKVLRRMRAMFIIDPLDRKLQPLLYELEEWLKVNRCRYQAIVLPTSYPHLITEGDQEW